MAYPYALLLGPHRLQEARAAVNEGDYILMEYVHQLQPRPFYCQASQQGRPAGHGCLQIGRLTVPPACMR